MNNTTFILGGRRFGKTTLAFEMAREYKEKMGCKVYVLYPNMNMAQHRRKEYPEFMHYDVHQFMVRHLGRAFELNSLFVVEEVNLIAPHIVGNLQSLTEFYETILTASPKLYNGTNKPMWVRLWDRANNQIILDEPEGDRVARKELLETLSPLHKIELQNVMAEYVITDIDLPDELAHLKTAIIGSLNQYAYNS